MTKPMVQPMPASTFARALLPAIAPHSVATSEAPARPLTTALVTVLLWLLVCAMYVMLVQNAGLGNGPGEVWQPVITATIMMSYLPLIIASVVLVFAFARYPDTILSPRGLASVGCLMLLVVLPLMQTASVLTTLWFKNQPLDQFFIRLEARGFFIWWLHGCTIALAFGAQAAYASLQRTRMQELAWQREQTERLALRLRLLQGQLKPHFLFNALNSISALVRTADRDLACKALAQLRDLLSYAVQASCHDWRSVADELGFVRDYLDLQMLRYGERLSLDWQVADCAWHELACPAAAVAATSGKCDSSRRGKPSRPVPSPALPRTRCQCQSTRCAPDHSQSADRTETGQHLASRTRGRTGRHPRAAGAIVSGSSPTRHHARPATTAGDHHLAISSKGLPCPLTLTPKRY